MLTHTCVYIYTIIRLEQVKRFRSHGVYEENGIHTFNEYAPSPDQRLSSQKKIKVNRSRSETGVHMVDSVKYVMYMHSFVDALFHT